MPCKAGDDKEEIEKNRWWDWRWWYKLYWNSNESSEEDRTSWRSIIKIIIEFKWRVVVVTKIKRSRLSPVFEVKEKIVIEETKENKEAKEEKKLMFYIIYWFIYLKISSNIRKHIQWTDVLPFLFCLYWCILFPLINSIAWMIQAAIVVLSYGLIYQVGLLVCRCVINVRNFTNLAPQRICVFVKQATIYQIKHWVLVKDAITSAIHAKTAADIVLPANKVAIGL